jgi:outer membrane immunogenic protein
MGVGMKNLLVGTVSLMAIGLGTTLATPTTAIAEETLDSVKQDIARLRQENAALRERDRLQGENSSLHERTRLRAENTALRDRAAQAPATAASIGSSPYLAYPATPPIYQPESPPVATGTSPAYAADQSVPIYKAAPPPVFNWTGFYLGGNLGYSVGRDDTLQTLCGGVGCLQGEQFKISPQGFIGGFQAGFNFQAVPHWVFGLEADIQASNERNEACVLLCTTTGGMTDKIVTDQSIDWFGTLRGRVGYAQNGWLLYATGGAAMADIKTGVSAQVTSSGGNTFNQMKGGGAVGGGAEVALGGNWSAKVEYLYMDFGSIHQGGWNLASGATPVTGTSDNRVQDHIFRGGVNYRFGPSSSPAYAADLGVAPYRPAFDDVNWSGTYIGANLGYSVGRSDTQQLLCAGGTCLESERFIISPAGVVGGVQAGHNWQFTPSWVFGVEADAQGSGASDSACVLLCTSIGGGTTANSTIAQTIDWFGTLRARTGASAYGWLLYVTAGGAVADIRTNATVTVTPGTGTASFSDLKAAPTVGGGAEVALGAGWSAKAEYLYMNFGNLSHTVGLPTAGTVAPSTTNSAVVDHVVRAGVNYRFSWF